MRLLLIFLVLLCTAFTINIATKKNYPQDYFRSPIDQAIRLSGTFGELRPNHFHAGIDIKSKDGKVGQRLFAIADGYVNRIKVQSGGYGNVLYIQHPNGYSSTYAHMDRYRKDIADFVKKAQYEKESFEVELFPSPEQFPLKKGEVIGRMGTSGRSFGPHVHFEIRDSRTEKPINPLLFGLKVEDTRKPKLHELKAYFLNDKLETLDTRKYDLSPAKNRYYIKGDTLNLGAWRVGFGLKVYDHMNGVHNWNGVYSIEMFQDDSLVYQFEMESFSFAESRYINAHLDYEEQVTKKSYFNRCYILPGNNLTTYPYQINHGVINLHKNKASKIEMRTRDIAGNLSKLIFWVKRKTVEPKDDGKTFNYILPYDQENIVQNDYFKAHFPNGSFYENLYLKYSSTAERSTGYYSSVHHLHDYKTPVHKYFSLAIKPRSLPDELHEKAFIAYCDKDNKISSFGGKWKDGMLQAMVRDLGDFCIMVDEIPPVIKPIHYQRNMKSFSKMTFKITDNIETTGRARGLKYKARVDGQWILMEYDAKKDLLIYRFDNRIAAGEHQLVLELWDNRNNKTIFEGSFVR